MTEQGTSKDAGSRIKFGMTERKDPAFVFCSVLRLYCLAMSIRNRAGEWEPLLLGIEPEHCGVCNQVLYRNTTMLKGGWERCSVCHRFVHYACLVDGKVVYLKRRPRVCLNCEHTLAESAKQP